MPEIWNLSSLCRCCHNDGDLKSLELAYSVEGKDEIYSDILRNTFGFNIVKPLIEASYSICINCIEDLKAANSFRIQIEKCEKKFLEYCKNEQLQNLDHMSMSVLIKEEFESDNVKNEPTPKVVEVEVHTEIKEDSPKPTEDNIGSSKKRKSTTKSIAKKETGRRKNTAGQTAFACEHCPKEFRYRALLKAHRNTHTKEVPYACASCGKVFYARSVLTRHLLLHRADRPAFFCATCGRRFHDRSNLRLHVRGVHERRRPFPCHVCGARLSKKASLRAHLQRHEGPAPSSRDWSCAQCSASFASEAGRRRHMLRAHGTGEAAKKAPEEACCDLCGRRFCGSFALKRHLRTHLGAEKPFACACGKRFSARASLSRHALSAHDPARSERPKRKCELCQRSYRDAERHMRAHRSRPALCQRCDKAYPTVSALNAHVRSAHLGEKLSCDKCGKSYATMRSLRSHGAKAHGVAGEPGVEGDAKPPIEDE